MNAGPPAADGARRPDQNDERREEKGRGELPGRQTEAAPAAAGTRPGPVILVPDFDEPEDDSKAFHRRLGALALGAAAVAGAFVLGLTFGRADAPVR